MFTMRLLAVAVLTASMVGCAGSPEEDVETGAGAATAASSPGDAERGTRVQMTGRVKWFNDAKGFGYITPADGSEACYAHHSEIEGTGFRSLAEGDSVRFHRVPGARGPVAKDIVRLGASPKDPVETH